MAAEAAPPPLSTIEAGPPAVTKGADDLINKQTRGVSPPTWHRRAGHLSPGGMVKMAAAVDGMHFSTSDAVALKTIICSPCIVAKMTRAPFPASTTTTTRALQLLHTDVCGPMPVASPGGRRYQVSIIDDHTHWKATIPIITKGRATDAVMTIANR